MSLIDRAEQYAKKCHEETNHTYDGHPYMVHLQMVISFVNKYAPIYLDEKYLEIVSAAALCHDVIEDCRQTYNDVKKALGDEHATNIVYALTNEKGKTRAERANTKYYAGIKGTPGATFTKLCDRLANVKYGLHNTSNMLETYREELDTMRKHLFREDYMEMWNELNEMLYAKV